MSVIKLAISQRLNGIFENDLIDECLTRYYETFRKTLDTSDFVPEKYNRKIYKYIFKNLKRKFREVDKEYKKQCKLETKQSFENNQPT